MVKILSAFSFSQNITSKLLFHSIQFVMLAARVPLARISMQQQIRNIGKSSMKNVGEMSLSNDQHKSGGAENSQRIQVFRKKLKLEPIPRVSPGMRFIDLMLVKTNPDTGELISNAEEDPTKWGDWQNGGRVSDF